MVTAVDSSVLVAALSSWHTRHVDCRRALAGLLSGEDRPVVPAHALVEAFSVLTRLPPGYRISPADAQHLLESALRNRTRIASERAASTWTVLADAVGLNAAGGAIYDLRIARAARAAGATRLLTLNADDFERLGIEDVEIVEP
jgi:predicted nucleic acid-binding protein